MALAFLFCPEVIARGQRTDSQREGGNKMAWDGYKSKRWRRLRRCILRRDGYRCREWARYGKAVEATTVHHVWPAEEYPEYAWAPWNLVSLSGDRHDAMHDRRTGRLTELGEAWRRRIAPPPSEPYLGRALGPGAELFPTAGNPAEGVRRRGAETKPRARARAQDAGANDAPG